MPQSRPQFKAVLNRAISKYPLAGALRAAQKGIRINSQRIHVVNEKLCDDALALLAPSLEEYKGCDIIDVFPGAGLWSRKVHEYLKPRSHILHEPLRDVYSSFLDPLVTLQGSKYRYGETRAEQNEKDIHIGWSTAKAEPRDTKDGGGIVNRSSLVLANFARNVSVTRSKAVSSTLSPSEFNLHGFVSSMIRSEGPHTYGPVRMLAWTMDRDKFHYLPRHIARRKNATFYTEDYFRVHEAVGDVEVRPPRRHARLDLQSIINTVKHMEAAGMRHPEHRRHAVYKEILACLEARQDSDTSHTELSANPVRDLLTEVDELYELERGYANGTYKRYEAKEEGADKRVKSWTEPYARREELRDKFDLLVGSANMPGQRRDDIDRCLFAMADRNQYGRDIMSKHVQQNITEPLQLNEAERCQMEELEARVQRLWVECGTRDKSTKAISMIDNHEAFAMKPPLLQWDRRPYEPLSIEEDEFYPMTKLALLDFDPLPAAPEKSFHSEIFTRTLRQCTNHTVTAALEAIALGSANDILPQCPSLSNPLVGGTLRPENLRVRMLTRQMWRELCAAWYKWPFRTSDETLLYQMGTRTRRFDYDYS